MGFSSDLYKVEPVILVDERSSTEYYIGISNSGRGEDSPNWQIRKVHKVGNVWMVSQYPNGDQSFKFVWNNRLGYEYV